LSKGPTFCFAGFELDALAYQLRRDGRVVPLSRQPMEALLLLVERRGELVSREDLGRRLWGDGVFLDRDAGLHTAILRIRQAIGETRPPAFIETVPGQGYRFVAQVRLVESDAGSEVRASTALRLGSPPTNLPFDLTSFVGREAELEELLPLIAAHRLTSVTGAGGCGKTRLAQQAGSRAATGFSDGVWFVDLAPIRDPELLPAVVARTLDVPEKPGTAVTETLLEWLAPRHMLLIMDNCEHLVDACATFVDQLLRGASRMRVLTTSREALNVPGEMIWRVPPMAFAPGPATHDLSACDAIRLFTERAATVAPFVLTSETAEIVADICRRLDGVPLAIELAAARVKILAVSQIRDRLHDRFLLLVSGSRTTVPRQRTLEATVDWSYKLLTDAERLLLMRLAVFAGGWSMEAAERVCAGGEICEPDVVDLLSRLADKSLVVVEQTADGSSRYRLLETIRQYAVVRLEDAGEMEMLAEAHFAYFAEAARRAEPEVIGPDQVVWLEGLESDHDNFRRALDWAMADPTRCERALGLANSLWPFWLKRGYFKEGRRRLERALGATVQPGLGLRACALIGLVHLTSFQGDVEALHGLIPQALDAARCAKDGWAEAYALNFAAVQEADAGHFEQSRELALAARDAAQRSTSHSSLQPQGLTWRLLGYWSLQAGDLERAGITFEEAVTFLREVREIWGLAILLSDLAALRVIEGRHEAAERAAEEALALCRRLRDRRGTGWCLQTLGMLETVRGRAARAASLYGAADALLHSIGATGQVTFSRVQDHYVGALREKLGETAFRDAFERGVNTPIDRIMEAWEPCEG
jgi:predicted ATPase/DNA-binding winged helix-turn-helix (wHTH) protein